MTQPIMPSIKNSMGLTVIKLIYMRFLPGKRDIIMVIMTHPATITTGENLNFIMALYISVSLKYFPKAKKGKHNKLELINSGFFSIKNHGIANNINIEKPLMYGEKCSNTLYIIST
jgi:hypothetical protein